MYGPTAHDADQGRRRPCHHYSMDPVAGMEVAGAGHYPWHSSMNLLNGTDLEQKKKEVNYFQQTLKLSKEECKGVLKFKNIQA